MASQMYYVFGAGGSNVEFVKASQAGSASKQIEPDVFDEFYDNFGLVLPPYNFYNLANLYEIDTWHRRCIIQTAYDSTGLGYDVIKSKFAGENPSEDDRKKVIEFFDNCGSDEYDDASFEDVLILAWQDYDSLGNFAIEVVRNGKNEPADLFHIPFKTVRIHKDRDKYAQIRTLYSGGGFARDGDIITTQTGTSTNAYSGPGSPRPAMAWFKRFGEQRELNRFTGEWDKVNSEEERAGELIHVKALDSKSAYYGIPEFLPAIGAIAANNAVRDYNIGKLLNRGVPDYIMTTDGMEIDEETRQTIKDFLNRNKTKQLKDGPKILTLEAGGGEIKFERVTPEEEDANWLQFRAANRDEIISAHGMPKYRLGIGDVGALGQNVAEEQSRIYSTGVVKHRRQRMEHVLNARLIKSGFGITDWRIKFSELDIRNELVESQVDKNRNGGVPIETINEQRRKREIGPDLEGGDRVMMRVGNEVIEVAQVPGSIDPESDPNVPSTHELRPPIEPIQNPATPGAAVPPTKDPAAPNEKPQGTYISPNPIPEPQAPKPKPKKVVLKA